MCWTSKLHASIALSTTEAEVNACTVAVQELTYVCGVLSEFGVVVSTPMSVFVDNQACIALSKHSINHEMTKHLAKKLASFRKKRKKAKFYWNFYPQIECRQIC